MDLIQSCKIEIEKIKSDKQFENNRKKYIRKSKEALFWLFRLIILVGICYVILGPLIGIVSSSFFSDSDFANKLVYIIPQNPTLERYRLASLRLDYIKTLGNSLAYVLSLMVIQVVICSMVGYGFARFNFPFKKLLFGFVIV